MDIESGLIKGCPVCGSKAFENGLFCVECSKYALKIERRCNRCGAFTLDPRQSDCASCRGKKLYFDSLFSWFIYSGSVSTVISKMKYGKIESFAIAMGEFMASNITEELFENCSVVFPPMNFVSKFRRSFNQAEIMADIIAKKHALNFERTLIKKVKKTKPQASLTYEERQTNLKNAFAINRPVKNEQFLIVDDVCTTFSTINTIAKLLKENGAESINAVTVARTTPYFT
jgi:competence protein ComFC